MFAQSDRQAMRLRSSQPETATYDVFFRIVFFSQKLPIFEIFVFAATRKISHLRFFSRKRNKNMKNKIT